MGALRKTLVYLGLAEDGYDEYETEDGTDERRGREQQDGRERPEPRPVAEHRGATEHRGSTEQHKAAAEHRGATVTHLPSAVRASGELQRITAVHPRSYNDAKVIGEHFRDGVPVIMNLTDMTDVEAKRLVDFAAGLVFGLHGAVERVTSKVFLLSPSAVEVTNEKQEAGPTQAFFDQT